MHAPNGAAAGAVPNGDDGAASGAAKAGAGAEAAPPKIDAGAAAGGAANDGVGAAASGADAEAAGSALGLGAPNGPAEGLWLKGEDAADADVAVVAGIVVEACPLPAAGCAEASGVGVVLASSDCKAAGVGNVWFA